MKDFIDVYMVCFRFLLLLPVFQPHTDHKGAHRFQTSA